MTMARGVLAAAIMFAGMGVAQDTTSATDTQTVQDISFVVGNRIDVQMSSGASATAALSINSADTSVIDDETIDIDYVFGSLDGGITAEVTNFNLDNTDYTPGTAEGVTPEDAGLGTSVPDPDNEMFSLTNGIRLALCMGTADQYTTTACDPLADPGIGWKKVNVMQAQQGVFGAATLMTDNDAGVAQEGEELSLKFAASKLNRGPEQAIEDLDLTVTFTVADY